MDGNDKTSINTRYSIYRCFIDVFVLQVIVGNVNVFFFFCCILMYCKYYLYLL